MANIITLDTGVRDYEINGFQAKFNPTDESFIARVEEAFESLDGLQDHIKEVEGFSSFVGLDAQMRVTIDGVLGEGAADAIFPGVNCYSLSGGLPLWLNLMYALVDEISEACEAEFGKTDERVKHYNDKYAAMMKKYRK
jgi:hypothetical protein